MEGGQNPHRNGEGGGGNEQVGGKRKLLTSEELYERFGKRKVGVASSVLSRPKTDKWAKDVKKTVEDGTQSILCFTAPIVTSAELQATFLSRPGKSVR